MIRTEDTGAVIECNDSMSLAIVAQSEPANSDIGIAGTPVGMRIGGRGWDESGRPITDHCLGPGVGETYALPIREGSFHA